MSIWPPIIVLALLGLSVGVAAIRAGQPKPSYHPGWQLLDAALLAGLLWWGGFFEPLVR